MIKDKDFWNVQGSGSFVNCKWCHGRGCLSCLDEYEKFMVERAKPIFTAKTDDPEEMAELKKVIGYEAIQHAFGPDGDGVREIELNACIQTIHRLLRASNMPDEKSAEEMGQPTERQEEGQ